MATSSDRATQETNVEPVLPPESESIVQPVLPSQQPIMVVRNAPRKYSPIPVEKKETVPGGRYMATNAAGQKVEVDAHGRPR